MPRRVIQPHVLIGLGDTYQLIRAGLTGGKLLLAGVPVHVVAARLGHADPAITFGVYAHRRLVRDDGADVVRPLRFATAAGSQLGLDRLPAGFADLPGGVGEVIFPRTLATFAAVSIRNSLGIAREIAQLSTLNSGLVVSGHLALPDPVT